MKISIIGVGNIGGTLAKQYREAGHTVLITNSRGPETLEDLAKAIGATAVAVPDATKGVDVVVVSIPLKNIPDLPKDLFAEVPDDVVVIDTSNYYPGMQGTPRIEAIEAGMPESQWVAAQLRRPVIKAYNSILAASLANKGRPKGTAGRIALPVAGDDPRAKAIVIGLLEATGFDGVDAGTLAESWQFQPGTPGYCTDLGANDLVRALAAADRAQAPHRRDLMMQKYAELGEGATGDDIINLVRSIVGTVVRG